MTKNINAQVLLTLKIFFGNSLILATFLYPALKCDSPTSRSLYPVLDTDYYSKNDSFAGCSNCLTGYLKFFHPIDTLHFRNLNELFCTISIRRWTSPKLKNTPLIPETQRTLMDRSIRKRKLCIRRWISPDSVKTRVFLDTFALQLESTLRRRSVRD